MPTVKLDKKDIFRVLLTDTAPGDVPIIFSNDGFYINSHSHRLKHETTDFRIFRSIYEKLLMSGNSQSYPYKYAIRKNDLALRGLSLIHPRAQLNFSSFYNSYGDVVIYLCSKSIASIRAPRKVGNSYFRNDLDKASNYKEIDIDTLENELSRKHSSSYFSYRGHNRLYKLFDSNEYVHLEKQYASFWMLDIANCFDSIYTHTISWAIKNKDFIKKNVDYRNQFCNEFDQLVQRSNNNETNGIPIGSETSRIFAEIIFQSIDCDVIAKLSTVYDYEFGSSYVFCRYVDDYAVFSKTEEISTNVTKAISDCLAEYNLYLSEGKIKKYTRPFNTEKSNIIGFIKQKIQEFEEKIIERVQIDDKRIVRPKKINRKDSIIKYFIGQMKYACNANSTGYGDVSLYLIATLSNRVIELVAGYDTLDIIEMDNEKLKYRDIVVVILKLMFFFYKVYPQVSSSYKLAKTIIIIDRFFSAHCSEYSEYFRTLIMEEIQDISFESGVDGGRSGFVALEGLNILLATSDFGINYLLTEERLNTFGLGSTDLSYFTLISLIYYMKEHDDFDGLRRSIEDEILRKLGSCTSLAKNSESAHLFLDSLSCPFLSKNTRKTILQNYLKSNEPDLVLSNIEIEEALSKLKEIYWFVKWRELDLVKLLERKELNNAY